MSKQFYQVYAVDYIPDVSMFTNITHLGLQCRPGLKFFINNSELTMNNTGIFELELDDNMPAITNFSINQNQIIGNTPLIIDIIGEIKGGADYNV